MSLIQIFLSYWSRKAAKEAEKYIRVNRVNPPGDDDESYHQNILNFDKWTIDKDAQYFHICQNETIEGIEYDQKITRRIIDRVKAENPNMIIVSDQSSVAGARDLTRENLWADYGVIFFGVHKNFGPSGLTMTLVRDDVMDRVKSNVHNSVVKVPELFDWNLLNETGDNYFVNTPTNITVMIVQQMMAHMLQKGGIKYYEDLAIKRADLIYDVIDRSILKDDFYYKCKVPKEIRSTMN
jgi:phosphoserine aminotransferase